MKTRRNIWGPFWRLSLCGLLLLWICHAIFTNEGRLALQKQGLDWNHLARTQQWQAAWTHGPRELWHTLRLVNPAAFALSVVLMGSTLLLGVLRWRMVLRVQGLELPFVRAGEISLVAHFFNSFLLGSTGGDLMKAYYAADPVMELLAHRIVEQAVDREIASARVGLRIAKSHLSWVTAVLVIPFRAKSGDLKLLARFDHEQHAKLAPDGNRAAEK